MKAGFRQRLAQLEQHRRMQRYSTCDYTDAELAEVCGVDPDATDHQLLVIAYGDTRVIMPDNGRGDVLKSTEERGKNNVKNE